ncbi:MAG: M48 family metallopeptidase [Dehalococcoidales bacterium]|nr:M48 family metallopeptidase [Dehalococcoidales bacterium]
MQRLKLVTIDDIVIDGRVVKYNLKQSFRARHVRLEIRIKSGLSVIVPRRYNPLEIKRFLQSKSRWILNKLEEYQVLNNQLDNQTLDNVVYLGKPLKLMQLQGEQEYAQLSLTLDKILVTASTKERTGQVLKEWYLDEAKELITQKAAGFSRKIGVKYNKLTIKSARTRWGSCSRLGNLNFNWKIIMVPEMVIDYIVIHELCHLKRMDHSSEFWKLVKIYSPDYYQHRKWLKEHEAEINRLPI